MSTQQSSDNPLPLSLLLAAAFAAAVATAPATAAAAADDKQKPVVLLWPAGAPGSEGQTAEEKTASAATMPIQVTSVHKPSLTVYLPTKETNTKAAVIVIPGGGHRMLVMEHEGYAVARWLSERGIAAFILKYRLARDAGSTYQIETHALGDTQRAIRLVRHNAKEWDVDPSRVGVLGFSAGGELAALASYKDAVLTKESDPIDAQNSRPDFQALIYPAIPKDMKPTKDSPPAFLACGFGDRQNISEGLPNLYLLFKQAGVATDLHVYAGAGHGFGIRETDKSPASGWPARFREWLDDRGFLKK
jgi:endo-1,4-beta-xylanase